ncbi:MAG: hypothetical protein H0U16_11490 [Actinobacteria bacterium]|nr:hypothetical protein [Actinomycetota bacterium]
MQREILEEKGASNLRVYAVWLPFLGGTQEAAGVSQRVLPDPRVVQYWDGAAATSDWFAENVEDSAAPAWDVYYLYEPDAQWTDFDVPGPLTSSGGTIIGRSPELKDEISRLLQASSPAP